MSIEPSDAKSSPASTRSNVVLPAPFGPDEGHVFTVTDVERHVLKQPTAIGQ